MTLVASWQVYCSSCGQNGVAPLKLGRFRRSLRPPCALLACGTSMLHSSGPGSILQQHGRRRGCAGKQPGVELA